MNSKANRKPTSVAGYSGTPLTKKLGLPAQGRALVVNAPRDYGDLVGELPAELEFARRAAGTFDFVHLFVKTSADLQRRMPALKPRLAASGVLWVSWPKKTSSLAADLDENGVREIGLATGLVDVKVCAVDADWSGLKFVYRVKDRH